MAYMSIQTARGFAPAGGVRGKSFAESELRKAASSPPGTRFDIFLSHARVDEEAILGVKTHLGQSGLSVYIDWIEDPQLNRSSVTARTADTIRSRMRDCNALIFATSEASPRSAWMPWELGYFDGTKPGHIALLPLLASGGASFPGQEYLGLYPFFEDLPQRGVRGLGIQGQGNQIFSPMDLVNYRLTK
jgi:hypothetical protein